MLKIIAALSENRIIGDGGQLPWKLPDDMKWFREKTGTEPVVMGRKTFESLPSRFRPLPDRENIVLTREPEFARTDDTTITNSFYEVLERSRKEDMWVIGGGQIYRLALPYTEMMYLTRVDLIVAGDTFFPRWKEDEWQIISSEARPRDKKHPYAFVWEVYQRINRPASP